MSQLVIIITASVDYVTNPRPTMAAHYASSNAHHRLSFVELQCKAHNRKVKMMMQVQCQDDSQA
jgi:hypothetical protein